MEEDQKVSDYFSKMTENVNLMKYYGENILDQMIVEKILRSLSQKFDFILVAIQESKDVKTMKVEELQSSLEAHELLVLDRSSERSVQQALQVQTGQIMEDLKLNLLKEDLVKIKTRRGTLIKVKFSAIIVKSMDTLLMNVGSRRIKRLKKPILLMKVTLIQCC